LFAAAQWPERVSICSIGCGFRGYRGRQAGNTNTSRQRGMHERHPYAMIATLSFAKEPRRRVQHDLGGRNKFATAVR
jgi:hypothetical protein